MKNQFNQKSLFRTSALLGLAFAIRAAVADSSISYTSGIYTQNFDSLVTFSPDTTLWTNNMTAPVNIAPVPPVQINNFVNGIDNTNGYTPVDLTGPSTDSFDSIQSISTMTGWYAINFGGNSSPLTYTVDDGTNGTAALTGFFNPNDPGNLLGGGTANNMALGATTASGSGNIEFGVKLVNNGTSSLNAISLSYAGELFHQDAGQKTLAFGYSVIANGTSSIPTSGLTSYGGLNVGGFATGATGSTFQTQSISVTNLPLATAWTPGSTLWLTWTMNSAGGGQGLAIDNLNFSASSLATLPTLTWSHSGNGNWDTTSTNWTGPGTVFASGNNVLFGNSAGNSIITVNSSGVTVSSSITINSSANTYTFGGGAIGGTGASLIVMGGGTVRLTAANTYGFATNVLSGKLIFDNNNELGASTAALNLEGGTVGLAASVNAGTRVLSVTGAGGTFNTAGFTASFGATTSSLPQIQGVLDVTGGGTLNLGVAPVFGNSGAPLGHLVVDAGTTVIIQGNGRSSPTDMWDGGVINGTLVLQTAPIVGTVTAGTGGRFNFESATANGATVLTGVGVIQIPTGSHWLNVSTTSKPKGQLDGSGAIISNTSGSFAAEIDVNIQLDSLEGTDAAHPAFVRTDVTSPHAFDGTSTAGNFITVIGGTKKAANGIGPTFSLMTIGGVISGDSDISIGNDYKSGGSGNLILTAHNTYNGVTMLNGGGTSLPVLYLGINNALPTNTDLVFGSINGAGAPSLDMNGFNQTIQSLCVGQVTNAPEFNQINNSGATPATLTISGSVTPFTSYNGQINDGGPTSTDSSGNINASGGSTTAIVKLGSGTLVLGEYIDSLNGGGDFTHSTYSGGTTAGGGIIQIPFDGALGAPTGKLKFDGGTVAVVTPDLNYDAEPTVTWNSSRPIIVTANGGTINTPTFTVKDSASNSHVLVASVVFTNNGGYNWGGTLQLTGAAGSNTTINGGAGSVTVSGPAAISISPTVSLTLAGDPDPVTDSLNPTKHVSFVNNGQLQISGGNKTLGAVSGAGTLTQSGPGTTTLAGPYTATGPVAITAGKLAFASTTASRQTSGVVVKMQSLTMGSTQVLDMTNHDLIIGNTSYAAVQSQIQAAFGAVSGPAITTSTSNVLGTGTDNTLPIPIDPAAFGLTSWDNVSITEPNSIIVKYTLFGDSTLDGTVNGDDFSVIAGNFGKTSPGISNILASWLMGDVTLDGFVNGDDFSVVAGNFGKGPLGTLDTPDAPAVVSSGGGSSNVPEPTSLALLGIGAAGLLLRRKMAVGRLWQLNMGERVQLV